MNSYQEKMLKPSKELFEKYRYNDDIEYLVGDDFNYKSDIEYPNTSINKLVESVAKEEIPFEYEEIDYEKADLSHLTGTVEEVYININEEFLSRFSEVHIAYTDSLMEIRKLKDASYDGISYYCKSDSLLIPSCIKDYILSRELKCKVSIYNYAFCKENLRGLFNCQIIDIPELKFIDIPKRIKYAKLKENKYIANKDSSILYLNLPREYYRKICCDNETLAYNINKQCFIGHSNCNQTKLNHLCYDIAKNGFQKIIQLKLLEDGRLMPYFSNKRVLMAEYLNLPTIPAAIVLDSYKIWQNFYYDSGNVRNFARKYLEPYFIF